MSASASCSATASCPCWAWMGPRKRTGRGKHGDAATRARWGTAPTQRPPRILGSPRPRRGRTARRPSRRRRGSAMGTDPPKRKRI
eukprot:8928120-Prorocentrum_lima.AAC.1